MFFLYGCTIALIIYSEEIPKARMDSGNNKPSIPSDDQIAYPGL
jgi:hypothetical protein